MSAVRPTKAAKRLIEVAEQLGYSARQTAKGHYRFAHPNDSLIFAGGKEQIIEWEAAHAPARPRVCHCQGGSSDRGADRRLDARCRRHHRGGIRKPGNAWRAPRINW